MLTLEEVTQAIDEMIEKQKKIQDGYAQEVVTYVIYDDHTRARHFANFVSQCMFAVSVLTKLKKRLQDSSDQPAQLPQQEQSKPNSRDTQFKGFAKLLLDNLGDSGFIFEGADDHDREEQLERIEALIARRAYDLACYIAEYVGPIKWDDQIEWDDQYIAKLVSYVPRLTELPKEQE